MIDNAPIDEVVFGAGAAVIAVAVALLDRRVDRYLLLLWVALTSLALVWLDEAPIGLVFAVAVTVASPVLDDDRVRGRLPDAAIFDSDLVRRALVAAGLAAVVLVLTNDLPELLPLGALAAVAAGAPLLWVSHRSQGQAVTVMLVAASAVGIYVNVPDTESIAVVGAGLLVLGAAMVAFEPLRATVVRFEALALVAALVVCAGAIGARGRPAAFVGVVGALGVLLAEPVAGAVRRGTRARTPVLIVIHGVAVLVASRVAGVRDVGPAAGVVAAVLAASVVALSVLPRRRVTARTEKAKPSRTTRR